MSYTYKDYETGDEYDRIWIVLRGTLTIDQVLGLIERLTWETDGEFEYEFEGDDYVLDLVLYPKSRGAWNGILNVLREHREIGTMHVCDSQGVLELDFNLANPFHYQEE